MLVLQKFANLNKGIIKQNIHNKCIKPINLALLLIIAGDVENNPGPPKYPCGLCLKSVRSNQDSVCCDTCEQWFHRKCMNMPIDVFSALGNTSISWHCCNCGLPNISSSYYDNTRDPVFVESDSCLDDSDVVGHPIHASSPVALRQRKKPQAITILSINCNSIRSIRKQGDFLSLIDAHNPTIILGCESKLSSDIATYECFPKEYEVYRKDRNSNGGGVFIAIDKKLTSKHETSLNRDCETVWASIQLANTQKLFVASHYRPPNSKVKDLEELESAIMEIHQTSRGKHPNCIIGGDFNCPGITWAQDQQQLTAQTAVERKLLDIYEQYDLTQHVHATTRPASGNILDIMFSSKPNLITNTEVHTGISDHNAVLATVDTRPKLHYSPTRKIFQFRKADFDSMNLEALEFNSTFMMDNPSLRSVEENWKIFKDHLNYLINKFVPSKLSKNKRHLPWVSRDIKRLMRKRERLYKIAREDPRKQHWASYNKLRNRVKKTVEEAHKDYVNGLGNSLKSGESKKFYSYIKLKRTENIGIPVLQKDGAYKITDSDKAEALNLQFKSAFVEENPHDSPNLGPSPYPAIGGITFTKNGIVKLLRSIKPGKAGGPDNLPAHVLKELAYSIADVITFIFQQSYDQGKLPRDWLQARVTALYKKGDKMNPANYRPVSLTCLLCKTMEHVMFSHIASHLERYSILTPKQHGFRSGYSCSTQLVTAIHDWAETLNRKGQTDVALLDFSKAFDRVPHSRLATKLEYYGIQGNVLQWIKAFLCDRKQTVVVNGSSSRSCEVSSGVPQGTVMGPLLFLIFINDITKDLHSELRLFADDSTLYREIRCKDDHSKLQQDLTTLEKWADKWKMDFNVSKCAIMTITLKKAPSIFNYKMKDQIVPRTDAHDYLGVTINSKLSWDSHCKRISAKAMKTLGMLRRNLHCCKKEVKSLAYITLVKPQVEYASCAWSPYQDTYIKLIEKVQNAAARFATGDYGRRTSVSGLVNSLNWISLEKRRMLEDLKLFHKIEHGIVNIKFPPAVFPAQSVTRKNHERCKFIVRPYIDVYKHSFFIRTIHQWNDLSSVSVEINNSADFMESVKKTLL